MKRVFAYTLLFGGSAMFLLPLIWMVTTALKPNEQTMSIPPVWLPRKYEAEYDGKRSEVVRAQHITEPSLWVQLQGEKSPAIVPAGSVRDGQWFDARGFPTPVEQMLKEVPARPNAPWEYLRAKDGSWRDVVPAKDVRSEISFRWENFPVAIQKMQMFPRYLLNTVILCVLNVVGTVFSSSLVAYGFARINWKGRDKVFLLVLATMMIPFPVLMIPHYALFRELGMVGTLQPLWIGSFFAGAFNVFLLRQFFRGLPDDLTDAARIDGCSEFRIYWQIILPLCKPALTVVALFTFLGTWNDFLGPLIYLTEQKDYTLMLGLQYFQNQTGTEWQYLMAASTLVSAPIIILFLFAQRTFIEGISLSGSKN